jgi:hypothetical protein
MIMRYIQLSQYAAVCLSMTGLQVAEYDDWLDGVLPRYQRAEQARLERPDRQREAGGGRAARLSERDQVLLSGVWLRQYRVHAVLAYLFGTSAPAVSRYLAHGLPILSAAGKDTMRMPDPGRKRRRSLDELLNATPELVVVIDSFEQKVQRPTDPTARDALYSGKKKTHTLKSQVSVDEDTGEIVDVSESVPGPLAAVKLVKQSGVLERWPHGVGAIGDAATRASTTCTHWPTVLAKSRVARTVPPKTLLTRLPSPAVALLLRIPCSVSAVINLSPRLIETTVATMRPAFAL